MIDSVEGGGDPVLTFVESILDRYGVETGGSALAAGPAIFAESVAGPLFGGIVPDTDDILGRMGRMGSISLWLSYMDDPLGARSGPGRGRPLGYRRFLSLDPYYLAVEATEHDPGDWPLYKGNEAKAYEDPEAWKYWTLFPEAPAEAEAPPTVAPVADGPWSSTGAKGRPLAAALNPALRGRTRPDIGDAGPSSLVAGRGLSGAWSVDPRSLPALASGLSVASRRGVGEVIGGAWGAPADPALVHLARTGLSPVSSASGTLGQAPELRLAGLLPGGAAAAVADPKMVKMGVADWGGGSQDPSGPFVAGAWGAIGGPSLLGRPQGWGPDARPDAALPSLPRAVARMLPRGWRDLVGADAGSTPLRTPLAPVSAAEAAHLVRSAPEVSKWFRFVGRRAVADPAAAPGLPGARALDVAYVAWVESVRQASDWSTAVAATGSPAHDDQQWDEARRAEVDSLPSELRAAGRVLQQAFPGASGDLVRRLERQLPAFVRSLLEGGTQHDAAVAASLPQQVAEALAKALTPTLRKARAFMPQGMVDTGGRAGADEPWPTSAPGRGTGSLADAPYAPVLSVLVQRAQARGVLKTGVTGLAPAQLLDALSTGRGAQGLPGPVLSLLRDIRSGAQAAMSAPRAAQALRSLLATPMSPTSGASPGGPWSTLAAIPRGLRTQLLRAVVKPGTPPESLRAALSAAGLPAEPTQAVAALLRREGGVAAAPELLRKYLRAAGLGEWSRFGFSPTDDEAASASGPPDRRPGRLGGTVFGWTPGSRTGPATGEIHGPAILSQLQARAGWSDDAVGAEGFTPVIVGGQVRWLRLPDAVADPTLPRLDRPSADPGLWPATETGRPVSAGDASAERGDLFPSDDQAVAGVVDSTGRPLRDTAWIRQAMKRAGVASPGLLLPQALRAALGGLAVPADVIRAVLGMTPGGGKPASIDSLVELLAPLRRAGGRRALAAGVARIGPVGPAEAAANRERARLETLADRLGATLAAVARRARGPGEAWPTGVGIRLRGGSADVGVLLKRVESGDRDLWRRIVTAMGPAATSAQVGETLTPELLRSVLEEGPSYDAEGAGELIGGDRRKSRGLRRQTEQVKKTKVEQEKQLRVRAEKEFEVQRERVAEERARRPESHTEPLGERTLKLVRALFPHSAERLPHALRRSAFPGGMPASNEPDLMLVAPTTEIIRREAGALFKENPQADEVRAGASQAPTQQRGDDPARVEKFLSPEKIEEFARRSFEMLIDEIALDAERHGLDPYGFE